MKNRLSSRSSSRGLAFLEAILFVPVWIVLLAGLFHVVRVAKSMLEMRSEARDCAHRIALSSCEEIPAECRGEEDEREESADTRGTIEKGRSLLRSTRVSSPTDDAVEGALEMLGGRRISVSRESSVKRSLFFGGDESPISTSVRMPCTPKMKTPEDSAFGTMGLIGGGF